MLSSAALSFLALLVLGLAVALIGFMVWRSPLRRRLDDLPMQWPLIARPVFSNAERRLYRQLTEALPRQVILAKLPLVRLCQTADPDPDPAQVRYWFRMLGGTYVSFAVCDAHGRVIAAVDLISERSPPSLRTQRIKAAVLHVCRVRYLTCTPDALPTQPTLRALVPQPFAELSGAGATPPESRPAAARSAKSAAATGDFEDSFFLPRDGALGDLTSAAPPDGSRARH